MLTKTFRSLLIASVAGTVLLAGCTKPAPDSKTDDSAVAIVKLETPPAGQLPEGITPTAYRLDVITDPAKGKFNGQDDIH